MTTDEREAFEAGVERAVSRKIDRDSRNFHEVIATAVDRAVTRWLDRNAEDVVAAIAHAATKSAE
jgi:hypothetical protein